jgi:hypothetical protein
MSAMGPGRDIAMRTPVHSLFQELTISLFSRLLSSNDTIPVEVSDKRGGVFDEAYTDLISSPP